MRFLTTKRTYPFNPRAAEDVLRIFKETVKFAGHPPDPQADIDEIIQTRPRILGEEVLAMGKIRIQYRGEPDRSDFELLRNYFSAKAKAAGR